MCRLRCSVEGVQHMLNTHSGRLACLAWGRACCGHLRRAPLRAQVRSVEHVEEGGLALAGQAFIDLMTVRAYRLPVHVYCLPVRVYCCFSGVGVQISQLRGVPGSRFASPAPHRARTWARWWCRWGRTLSGSRKHEQHLLLASVRDLESGAKVQRVPHMGGW